MGQIFEAAAPVTASQCVDTHEREKKTYHRCFHIKIPFFPRETKKMLENEKLKKRRGEGEKNWKLKNIEKRELSGFRCSAHTAVPVDHRLFIIPD